MHDQRVGRTVYPNFRRTVPHRERRTTFHAGNTPVLATPARHGEHSEAIDKKTLNLLLAYDWPGNISRVAERHQRSVILSTGTSLAVDESWPHGGPAIDRGCSGSGARPHRARSERELIEAALAESRGASRVRQAGGEAGHSTVHARSSDQGAELNKMRFSFI